MSDLLTAIQTLSTKLIPNSKGDKRIGYISRLNEYSGRLLASVLPVPDDGATLLADPLLTPVNPGRGGKLVSIAAALDAASIAAVNNGDDPIAAAAAYAGQAAAEGYNNVIGVGTGSSITFTVFLNGAVAAVVKGDGQTDVSALADQYGLPN